MSEDITKEEREQIISKMESEMPRENSFNYIDIANTIDADPKNDKECWQKLISLIKSAPVKKSMRAAEFADKLQEAVKNEGNIYDATSKCLGYDGHATSGSEDVKKLIDAIRDLDAPESEAPSWPRDSQGDLLDVGDIVIYDGRRCVIRNFEYYGGEKNWFIFSNGGKKLDPEKITKAGRPRTLNELEEEIKGFSVKGLSGLCYDHDRIMSLFYDIVQAWDREVKMEDDE